jgi:RNA polymerase sigma-70 factor (ECF subfamily)
MGVAGNLRAIPATRREHGEFALPLSQAEFDRLVSDHGPALFRIAYRLVGDRHEAEDIVQDTYRSAWKSRQGYKVGHASLRQTGGTIPFSRGQAGDGKLTGGDERSGERAWLTSILRRRVVDRWRKRPAPGVVGGDVTQDLEVDGDDPLANDYTDEMQRALNRLPTELRECLLLVVVGELTHQEVADLLSVPLGTVLSRVSRARGRLREYWLSASRSANE